MAEEMKLPWLPMQLIMSPTGAMRGKILWGAGRLWPSTLPMVLPYMSGHMGEASGGEGISLTEYKPQEGVQL